jgi:60 kDa SS-A/Ro ribonucleoprotein
MSYASHLGQRSVPQSEALPGQIENLAGGFVYAVDDWVRLDRFLILGAEGGTYYAGERKLTLENAAVVGRCADADWRRTVDQIVTISDSGRAVKNEPALMALAIVAKKCFHAEGRAYALAALPKVARIGTHLFHFAEYIKALGGWGRGTRRAAANWYLNMPAERLAFQAIKYQQRDGWSHRDLLRKSHPRTDDETKNAILNWMVKGWPMVGTDPHTDSALVKIWAFERAKTAKGKELIKLITEYNLPHECVPNEQKGDPAVWDAMLPQMGLTAMIRNLGKMTAVGLTLPMSDAERLVADRLGDLEALRKARIHPLSVLVALKIYQQGHGDKGSLLWDSNQGIADALDGAFYLAFKAVEPTGKRHLLALDISGSMSSPNIAGMPGITPRVGSAAMALITANVEANYAFVGFTERLSQLAISPRQRLDDVVRYTDDLRMGATDCAQPMIWALENRVKVDVFCIYTDSETWYGAMHPKVALEIYRQKMGINAKMAVIGMVTNGFSIADPTDAGQIDLVGFDSNTPAVLADFAR